MPGVFGEDEPLDKCVEEGKVEFLVLAAVGLEEVDDRPAVVVGELLHSYLVEASQDVVYPVLVAVCVEQGLRVAQQVALAFVDDLVPFVEVSVALPADVDHDAFVYYL